MSAALTRLFFDTGRTAGPFAGPARNVRGACAPRVCRPAPSPAGSRRCRQRAARPAMTLTGPLGHPLPSDGRGRGEGSFALAPFFSRHEFGGVQRLFAARRHDWVQKYMDPDDNRCLPQNMQVHAGTCNLALNAKGGQSAMSPRRRGTVGRYASAVRTCSKPAGKGAGWETSLFLSAPAPSAATSM